MTIGHVALSEVWSMGIRLAGFAVAAIALLFATTANAALIVNVDGITGSGVTTWTLAGSSTAIAGGSIRTGVGSSTFDLGDSFEPDVTGNFFINAGIQDTLFVITGTPTITVGGVTQTITHIFLDEDGASRDDFGIRTDVLLSYLSGDASSWSGSFTVALDISNFNLGTYRLNTAQANGGGFSFAAVNDTILNFSEAADVPEPGTGLLLGFAFAATAIVKWRKR